MVSAANATLPLWAAVFGTLYQITILILLIVKFNAFIEFCKGANKSGEHYLIKNALVYTMYSYFPLTILSITFMWVSYSKDWSVGIVFVLLPVLSILFYVLVMFGTVNDISGYIDNSRRGRKRLPIQPPPQLIVVPVDAAGTSALVVTTPERQMSPRGNQTPALPIQQR